MPRARNQQTTASILDSAWRLFTETGYDATSYAEIARESGISRSLVQKYFPKKEDLAVKNLSRLRGLATAYVAKAFPDANTPLEKEYVISQVYIAALMSCDSARVFFRDVLRDRELTRATIQNDTLWTITFLQGNDIGLAVDEDVLEDSTAALGALYETAYFCIVSGRKMDYAKRLGPCLDNLTRISGCSEKERHAIATAFTLSQEQMEELGLRLFAQTLETPWSDEFEQ